MRRVVITGIGIVSSIGSNAEEVKKSLFDCTPGISKAIGYDNLGFKSQVYGSPNIDLEENIDRKKLRFLAKLKGFFMKITGFFTKKYNKEQ